MIDHVDLVVSSLERSLPFYRDLLQPLGWVRIEDIRGERGEEVRYISRSSPGGSIGLREAQSEGEIESGPDEYDYSPGYYAVFFCDPDGLKLEIVNRPR